MCYNLALDNYANWRGCLQTEQLQYKPDWTGRYRPDLESIDRMEVPQCYQTPFKRGYEQYLLGRYSSQNTQSVGWGVPARLVVIKHQLDTQQKPITPQ